MTLSTRMKAAAAIGSAAAAFGLMAAPAFAAGTPTGQEQVTTPVSVPVGQQVGTTPEVLPTDANGNPVNGLSSENITVTGVDTGGSEMFGLVCDGLAPTSPGYSIIGDCDSLTGTAAIQEGQEGNPQGTIVFHQPIQGENILMFRGVSPSDLFNCLAPQDDPTASQTNVPNLPQGGTPATIDPFVPSWGSSLPTQGGVAGGSASCQIHVGYQLTSVTSGDKWFPLGLQQNANLDANGNPTGGGPSPSVPESPLTIALPVGGVVLFGAAGAVLYRKRRSARTAA